jgi:hypothetical protein
MSAAPQSTTEKNSAGAQANSFARDSQTKKPRRETGLFSESRSGCDDAYVTTAERTFDFELHNAFDFSEEGVVLADANAIAGVELGAALTHDDITGLDDLAAEHFHAKAFTFGIATVAGTTTSFFVCHEFNTPMCGTG